MAGEFLKNAEKAAADKKAAEEKAAEENAAKQRAAAANFSIRDLTKQMKEMKLKE